MNINIGLSPKNLRQCSEWLNALLDEEIRIYLKTKLYHWNVKGPQYYVKYKFFEVLYRKSDDIMNMIAERIRDLGHYAVIDPAIDKKRLTEEPIDSAIMTSRLLKQHEAIIRRIRESLDVIGSKYNDAGTAELITMIMKEHESISRMLRSHLQ